MNTENENFEVFSSTEAIVVPNTYNHTTQLNSFAGEHSVEFQFFGNHPTNEHYSNPSRILKPGDRLFVRAFRRRNFIEGGGDRLNSVITSEDCLTFHKTQQAVYTGAQGLSLVWTQLREILPKGYRYFSFDEKERLWNNTSGFLLDQEEMVPFFNRGQDSPMFSLGTEFGVSRFSQIFDNILSHRTAFLCFYETFPPSAPIYLNEEEEKLLVEVDELIRERTGQSLLG